ncbi:hypothetical protein ACEOA1_10960, partial [Escherichia coli]
MLSGSKRIQVYSRTQRAGSSRSCSGAFVDDPDLHKNILICYPYGNYEYDNIIYVEKKTNALGVVVTYAQTARDDAE